VVVLVCSVARRLARLRRLSLIVGAASLVCLTTIGPDAAARPVGSVRDVRFSGTGTYCETFASPKPERWRCTRAREVFAFRLSPDRRTVSDFVGKFGTSACDAPSAGLSFSRIDVAANNTFIYETTGSASPTSMGGTYMFVTSRAKKSAGSPNTPVKLLARGRLTGTSTATVVYEFQAYRTNSKGSPDRRCIARVSGLAHRQR
jgi:hypothetical protein